MGHGVDSEPSGWVTDYALMASLFVFAARPASARRRAVGGPRRRPSWHAATCSEPSGTTRFRTAPPRTSAACALSTRSGCWPTRSSARRACPGAFGATRSWRGTRRVRHAGLLRPHDARRPRDRRRLRRLRATGPSRRPGARPATGSGPPACDTLVMHAEGLFYLCWGARAAIAATRRRPPVPRPPARRPRSDAAVVHFLFFDLKVHRATRFRLLHVANAHRPPRFARRDVPLIIYARIRRARAGHDGASSQPEPRRPHLPLRRALVPHADLLPGVERALPTVLFRRARGKRTR